MASALSKREILAVLMESPIYFNIPLQERLEFLKFFSQRSFILAPNWPSEAMGRRRVIGKG